MRELRKKHTKLGQTSIYSRLRFSFLVLIHSLQRLFIFKFNVLIKLYSLLLRWKIKRDVSLLVIVDPKKNESNAGRFTTSYPFVSCSLIRSFNQQSINWSNNQTSSVHGQLIFTSIIFALIPRVGLLSNVLYGEAQTQGDTCTSYDGL